MRVFDLLCATGHRFEGWFGSEAEFQRQAGQGLVTCPVCHCADLSRLPSAPRLNLGRHERQSSQAHPSNSEEQASMRTSGQFSQEASDHRPTHVDVKSEERQSRWLMAVKQVLANTEDVGEAFAEQARRMHYGEAPERAIRGRASPQQAQELLDEGIELLPLALPAGLQGPIQ